MARTHKKVRYSPKSKGKKYTPVTAAQDVEQAFKVLAVFVDFLAELLAETDD
jgi:hypothetical protein